MASWGPFVSAFVPDQHRCRVQAQAVLDGIGRDAPQGLNRDVGPFGLELQDHIEKIACMSESRRHPFRRRFLVPMSVHGEPDVDPEPAGEQLQCHQALPVRLSEGEPVDEDHLRMKDVLGRKVRQPLLQLGNGEPLHLEGHDEPVRQEVLENPVELGPFGPVGKVLEELCVPEADLGHGLIEADVQDIFFLQHGIEGQLHEKGRLSDPGGRQHRTEAAGRQNLFTAPAERPQRVAKDQIFFEHVDIPVPEMDNVFCSLCLHGRVCVKVIARSKRGSNLLRKNAASR